MRYILIPFCILSFLCMLMQGAGAQTARPNIIVILSDDMGYSDLSCYGGEIQTPVLDSLAHGGIRFTQFYNTARCCPTRASLLTGLHPHQAGIGHMMDDRNLPGYTGDLLPSCVTIAEALKASGYATYGLGKWHVTKHLTDSNQRDNYPTRRGFDRYYGIITGATNFFEPATLIRDETPISPMNDPAYKPDEYYFTTALGDNAVQYLNEHAQSQSDKPFFMYIAYTAAHWPMQALPRDIAKYEGMYDQGYDSIRQARFERMREMGLLDERWTLTPKTDEWNAVRNKPWEIECMKVYAAMVDSMDQSIGMVINALKNNGQYENTVILYLQDNGACAETAGRGARQDYPDRVVQPVYEPYPPERIVHQREEQRRTRDGFPVITGDRVMPGPKDTFIAYGRGWANVSNTPFREFKHWIHEGGISTPLIVHVPSLMSESMKGKFYNEPGQLPDIMATCLDLAGAPYPKKRIGGYVDVTPLQGTSLKPALMGNTLGRKTPLYWEHEGNRAIRDGKWKLVAKGPASPWELYDVDADRSEMNDLSGEHRELAEKMATQWENWAEATNVFPWPWAQYQRKIGTPPRITSGLVLEFLFENAPLRDSSPAENLFTINRAAQGFQQSKGVFDGNTWITIEKSDALDCSGIAWRVEAEIISEAKDGVIMSHGGSNHGYSLYLKEGKPGFAVRLEGKLHAITGPTAISGSTVISGALTSNRKLVLQVNGETIAETTIPYLIYDMPVDPPIVGNDLGGTVAESRLPPFQGRMKRIALYRGDKAEAITSTISEKPRTTTPQENPPPNIIVILIDDMGWADLSCFGNQAVQTPSIDRLAAEGTMFTNFYVASPICSPSRCALTTGQYPYRWRITSYLDNRQMNEQRGMTQWLDPKAPTLARFLNNAGYATGHFGKWHLGGQRDVGDAPLITEYGFDESLTNFEGLGPRVLPLLNAFDGSTPARHGLGSGLLGRGEITWIDRNKITHHFVDATLKFIRKAEKEGKPFYANLWLDDVHSPFFPSQELRGDGSKKALYHGVLTEMDMQLAPLFDAIRASETLRNNTLILLMSDNGHEPGAGSAGPLRGNKGMLYEGGVRSPLIVWGDGLLSQEAKGRRNETAVFQTVDLVPSLLKMVRVGVPSEVAFDGEDFSAVLLGSATTQERKAPIFWRRPPDRANLENSRMPDLALRDGPWKFLMQFDGSQPQLYNLDMDISESRNVASEHLDRVERYRNALNKWNASMPKDAGQQE